MNILAPGTDLDLALGYISVVEDIYPVDCSIYKDLIDLRKGLPFLPPNLYNEASDIFSIGYGHL